VYEVRSDRFSLGNGRLKSPLVGEDGPTAALDGVISGRDFREACGPSKTRGFLPKRLGLHATEVLWLTLKLSDVRPAMASARTCHITHVSAL